MYTENTVAEHILGTDTLEVRYYYILRPNTSDTEFNSFADNKHSILEFLSLLYTCVSVCERACACTHNHRRKYFCNLVNSGMGSVTD